MSEESNQNLPDPTENLEHEKAQCKVADAVVQSQPTDSEKTEKITDVEIADTNTPALIVADSSAEIGVGPIGAPCTGKPAAFGEDSNVDSVTKLLENTSTAISNNAEETLESNTETAALECPDVLPETDVETTIGGDKLEETALPNERSNETEESLESNAMNTQETSIPDLKVLELDSENISSEIPEKSLNIISMQTEEHSIIPDDVQLDVDPAENVSENDKCSVEEPLKDNISEVQTKDDLQRKDNVEIGKESIDYNSAQNEVVSLDLCNEDTVAEEKLSESSNKTQTMDELCASAPNLDKHVEETVEKPLDKMEKESPSPKAEEIVEKMDTLNEPLDKNVSVYKGNALDDKMPVPTCSTAVEVREEIETVKDHIKDIKATEDMPEETLETMDIYDSQESINLVIDETSEIVDISDANENQSKEDNNEAMDTSENISEGNQKDKVESPKPVEGENEKKNLSSEDGVAKSDKAIENISNIEEKTETTDDTKDDDVIPIEQPPMPIIEIDDDTDDEPSAKQSPLKAAKQLEEKRMEIDEDPPQEISSIKTAISMEVPSVKETQNSTSELLAVASEKSMVEVVNEDEKKINNDDKEDTTDEVFYNKECINYECSHKHKQFFRVPQFAFSYFKVNKKKFKMQYICADCYDRALEMFEEYCGLINAKQPLLMEDIPSGRQEFVEIIDSSDEEDGLGSSKVAEPAKSAFSKNDLSLIERELHNTIKTVLERVEIQNQLTWSKTILAERLKRLEMETEYVDNELRSLQRKADKMHEGLYSCPKIKIRQLQPLDLNSGKMIGYESHQQEVQPIPPVGEIERPSILNNGTYFAVKNNAIASWVPCKVVDQVEGGVTAQKTLKYYRIKFLKSQHQMLKTVPAKYLAYYEPPTVRLPIGTRVIAYFDATSLARGREKMNVQSAFYPGIIAEPLKPNNKFRYLIFYDDGYTQYVYHKDVRLVCHVSENVWEDVHPASRDFIQKYLTQYSINRPMVQTQKGQSMNTESNGYWLHARVVDIDCSLVLMQFEGSKSHTEWIYRGSLRLGPVFKEYQKTLQKNSNVPVSRLPRRTEPFIRYTEDEESSSQQQQTEKSNEGNRAVARKSFGRPESMMNTTQSSSSAQKEQSANIPAVKHLNNSTIYVEDENKPKGKVVYYTAKRNLPPRKYTPHMCSPGCLFEIAHNLGAYSPLSKPLLSGWERFIIRQKIKKVVTYRAPCGKIFRNMKELHHYLRVTKNLLNVDNFDFSPDTNCLAEYVIESAIIQKRDISCGQEKMAIPLVNYYDSTLPPECKYSAKVIPTEGVNINKDPEFFAGCDCDDDCSDKSKCSCWQLTVAGAKYGNPNATIDEVGYQYKRLLEHVPTGIYECNPRCKCKQNCLNRVVQHSLQLKLQVFKTSNRGWGLRCINDVPRGTFVCVYAGHLLTEAKANEGGQDAGDEYFAELDYIEVAEQIKEGYESEVEPPEPEDEDAYQPELDDDDFTPSKSFLTRSKRQSATKSTRPGNQEDDSQERQVINFNPNADMNEDSVRESSIRKLYGKDEACYVMDAKISGNLGRYFNHSCAPNMFVQNVFVDTHDLRFPWVAFFSSCNIRAGTELTWNYNYEVGVVPGKVLYCQCGAPTCRLRLL